MAEGKIILACYDHTYWRTRFSDYYHTQPTTDPWRKKKIDLIQTFNATCVSVSLGELGKKNVFYAGLHEMFQKNEIHGLWKQRDISLTMPNQSKMFSL